MTYWVYHPTSNKYCNDTYLYKYLIHIWHAHSHATCVHFTYFSFCVSKLIEALVSCFLGRAHVVWSLVIYNSDIRWPRAFCSMRQDVTEYHHKIRERDQNACSFVAILFCTSVIMAVYLSLPQNGFHLFQFHHGL